MPKERRHKVRLSKSILEMKFMQRTKNRLTLEREAEEGRTMYEKEITSGMLNAVDKFIKEPSYVQILNLKIGRVSYGGFNPEIEKLMEKDSDETVHPSSREMEKEVSDTEMAEYSSSLHSTMANKFNKKNKHKPARGFLKPQDN